MPPARRSAGSRPATAKSTPSPAQSATSRLSSARTPATKPNQSILTFFNKVSSGSGNSLFLDDGENDDDLYAHVPAKRRRLSPSPPLLPSAVKSNHAKALHMSGGRLVDLTIISSSPSEAHVNAMQVRHAVNEAEMGPNISQDVSPLEEQAPSTFSSNPFDLEPSPQPPSPSRIPGTFPSERQDARKLVNGYTSLPDSDSTPPPSPSRIPATILPPDVASKLMPPPALPIADDKSSPPPATDIVPETQVETTTKLATVKSLTQIEAQRRRILEDWERPDFTLTSQVQLAGKWQSGNGKMPEVFIGSDDFDDMADFGDEEELGEEGEQRRWLMDQESLEEETDTTLVNDSPVGADYVVQCPLCGSGIGQLSDREREVHVNRCLDGGSSAEPSRSSESSLTPTLTMTANHRLIRPPRPGQASPFEDASSSKKGSAFSALMSSHAEARAWQQAADSETASRGKPSYTRTCPFYKILPGYNITVDAFRFGAVQGCNAYFLSHFHSDHYVGLTASWSHGPIYCSRATANLVRQNLRVQPQYVFELPFETKFEVPGTGGVEVTLIDANHCPGSALFLFEKTIGTASKPRKQRILHCGDFRANPKHLQHPLLRPDVKGNKIDSCYLDTTYLNPKYSFPTQEDVITACGDMCRHLNGEKVEGMENLEKSGMAKFLDPQSSAPEPGMDSSNASSRPSERLLVVVGTYSIGKERVCKGIAKALGCKIYAAPNKQRICKALEDPELDEMLTSDKFEANIHMTPLMEIRAEEYLNNLKPHFTRVVGFRPSGWTYRPPNSRFTDSPTVASVLHSPSWKSTYSVRDLAPQRGSNLEARCFGVPYSEHSSFRELTMFCTGLDIGKIIPTVNINSAKSRDKMKAWFEKWDAEKRKSGLYTIPDDAVKWP